MSLAHLFPSNLEGPILLDMAEDAVAEVHALHPPAVHGDHPLEVLVPRERAAESVDDACFVAPRNKRRIRTKGNPDPVALAGPVVLEEKGVGQHLHHLLQPLFILLMFLPDAGHRPRPLYQLPQALFLTLALRRTERIAVILDDPEDRAVRGFHLLADNILCA